MYKNIKKLNIISFSLICLTYVFLFIIKFINAPSQDEAYAYTLIYENYIGKIPFYDLYTCYPGFIIFQPFYFLFRLFSIDNSGIILYFRIIHFLLIIILNMILYGIFNNFIHNKFVNILLSSTLSLFTILACNYLSYNYILVIAPLISTSILYSFNNIKNKYKYLLLSLITNFILILFYPTAIIFAIIYIFLIIFRCNFDKKSKIKLFLIYSLGGILLAIIFTIYLYIRIGSINSIINTLMIILHSPHELNKYTIFDAFILNCIHWKKLIILTIFFITLIYIFYKIMLNKKFLPKITNFSYLYFIYSFFIIGFIYFISSDQQNFVTIIQKFFVLLIASFIFLLYDNYNLIIYFIPLTLLFIPTYILFLSPIFFQKITLNNIINNGLPIFSNKFYMNDGIYKGLYINENNKKIIDILENEIKKYIDNKNENVCELITFPALYLALDSKVNAPSSWDIDPFYNANLFNLQKQPETYKFDNLISYFNRFKNFPEYFVIVNTFVNNYDIDNDKWEINNLLKNNYKILYSYNDTFQIFVLKKYKEPLINP